MAMTSPEGTVKRLVDDPLITPAELEARRRRLLERGSPRREGVTPPGKIEVDVKLSTLIGGLARIEDRTEEQTLAAARYRGLFERSQLGGARAIDYSDVRVDSSSGSLNLVFEIGEDARREYRRAVQRLGMIRSSLVENVVCHDMSMRRVARVLEHGDGGAAQGRVRAELLSAVDVLVDLFGFGRATGGRGGYRFIGELPREIDASMISTRRSRRVS